MAFNDDEITVCYYTAWDGFSWQGCDEVESESLQKYMEATGTLPESSVEKPPFGGAVPCKIGGVVGVAVYRYHTRKKGDISKRDSLYIALAFVPLKVGCVDFGEILNDPKLSATKDGALGKESLSAAKFRIALDADRRTSDRQMDWMDKKLADEFVELSGREGLCTLSRLFFSERAQLGFLNAVFTSDSGVDEIVSKQTYHVYREVASVVAASERLRKSGLRSQDETALNEMKSAVDALGKLATKVDYSGLRKYYDLKAKEAGAYGTEHQLSEIADFVCELERLCGNVKRPGSVDGTVTDRIDDSQKTYCEECIKKAKYVLHLPVTNNQEYRNAVKRAIDAICNSSYESGYIDGFAKCRNELQGKINQLQSERAIEQERNAKSQDRISPCATAPHPGISASPLASGGAIPLPVGHAKRKSYRWILEWALIGLISAAIAAAAVVIIYMLVAGRPSMKAGEGRVVRRQPAPSTNVVEAGDREVTIEAPVIITTNKPNNAQEEADPKSRPGLVEEVSPVDNVVEAEIKQEHVRHNGGGHAATQKSGAEKSGNATGKSAPKTTQNSTHPVSGADSLTGHKIKGNVREGDK